MTGESRLAAANPHAIPRTSLSEDELDDDEDEDDEDDDDESLSLPSDAIEKRAARAGKGSKIADDPQRDDATSGRRYRASIVLPPPPPPPPHMMEEIIPSVSAR